MGRPWTRSGRPARTGLQAALWEAERFLERHEYLPATSALARAFGLGGERTSSSAASITSLRRGTGRRPGTPVAHVASSITRAAALRPSLT